MGRGGEPGWCDENGEHGRRKWSGEGFLVIRKRGERHPIFQSVMQILGLVVGDLFKHSHHELEFILGHGNGG